MSPNPLKGRVYETYGNQETFGYVTKTHRSVVSRILNGWQTPTQEQEVRWSKALGISVEELREMVEASKPTVRRANVVEAQAR